jgi:gamma-polyglutamate synthase
MSQELWIVLAVALGLAGLGVVERRRFLRNIARIPIRIHVNGTRGKSSVVRLIAAGLRQAGIRTFAKTSGTVAARILPDGSEQPVERRGKANVSEQARIVSMAAAGGAQALVIECMALHPTLQSVTERHFIRSTHGVLTNVGPDHLEIMGPAEADVARAMAGAVPAGGKLFTGEQRHLPVFQAAVRDRQSELVAVDPSGANAVTPEEMAGFEHIEHAGNVAVALSVCADLGVDRDTALRGMWTAPCDAGALTVDDLRVGGRRVCFVNAFAANDPRSTDRAWRIALTRFPDVRTRVVLVNCRAERTDRSGQLGAVCAGWPEVDHVLVMGRHTSVFTRAAVRHGVPEAHIRRLHHQSPYNLFGTLLELADPSALVVGVGNMGRAGLAFVQWLRQGAYKEKRA